MQYSVISKSTLGTGGGGGAAAAAAALRRTAAANRRRCDLGDGHCADREPQPLPVDDV